MDCLPEPAERPAAAGVIPHARRHDAVAARHARHLPQPGHGLRHEVDDELRQGGVERPIVEGQLLRGRTLDLHARVALSQGSDELA